jgi:hypothetical protein
MKKQILIELVKFVSISGLVEFNTPVAIKNGIFLLCNIWHIMVSADNEVYAMDSDQDWHKVEEHDTVMINALTQRLRFLQQKQQSRKEEVL